MLDPNIYGRDCALDPEPEHPRLAADNPGGGYKWITHVNTISMGFDGSQEPLSAHNPPLSQFNLEPSHNPLS